MSLPPLDLPHVETVDELRAVIARIGERAQRARQLGQPVAAIVLATVSGPSGPTTVTEVPEAEAETVYAWLIEQSYRVGFRELVRHYGLRPASHR